MQIAARRRSDYEDVIAEQIQGWLFSGASVIAASFLSVTGLWSDACVMAASALSGW